MQGLRTERPECADAHADPRQMLVCGAAGGGATSLAWEAAGAATLALQVPGRAARDAEKNVWCQDSPEILGFSHTRPGQLARDSEQECLVGKSWFPS